MIYKLRADRSTYLSFDIAAYDIEMILGDYFLLDEPLWADFWKLVPAKFYDDSDVQNAASVPDITVWGTNNCLALNQKAYSLLKNSLEHFGELLPVTLEGIEYWLFHSTHKTNMEYIDLGKSERVVEEGGFIDMKSLVFNEDKLVTAMIFQTEFNGYRNMYCTEEFKLLVGSAELKGLNFSIDLASINEP